MDHMEQIFVLPRRLYGLQVLLCKLISSLLFTKLIQCVMMKGLNFTLSESHLNKMFLCLPQKSANY